MALTLLSANNASTVLAAGISASATTLTVNTGTGGLFPSPVSGTSFFKLTLIDSATGTLTEIVHVTARSGDAMTIVRGQEGTANRLWSANDIAANMMTAGTLDLFAQSGGLGGAALLNVGTTAGTVAAGNDNRITGALQKSANLSDLTNAPTARTNLELGTAATKNVGTGVGQIPDMSSFISSFAQNGYFKFPGGLIIQWGEVTGSTTGTVPANFPIPFPNALVSTALAIDLIGPSYATLQNQTLVGISVNTWNSAGNRAALAIRYISIGW
ncbi:hypothetical protein SM885_003059 [Yersinia enterocolitica]|nr:hypothetical protein [Yersinia enterocolitica]